MKDGYPISSEDHRHQLPQFRWGDKLRQFLPLTKITKKRQKKRLRRGKNLLGVKIWGL
jgi:hypothetical protein